MKRALGAQSSSNVTVTLPAWGNAPGNRHLFPNVRLIVYDTVFFQKPPKFILKGDLLIMLFLAVDIANEGILVFGLMERQFDLLR